MKTIKILVAVMALLIVVGLGLLAWGMSRASSKLGQTQQSASVSALPVPAVAPPAAVPAQGGYFSADISLPPGSRLEQMSTTADRVILRLMGPDGERLIVLDPTNGRVAGTVTLSATPPLVK